MLGGNEGIHHSPIVLVRKSKGCCLVFPLVSLTEENQKAKGFFLDLTILWLVGPKNDLWVLLSPILLCFIFSFGCFGWKIQRLMLGTTSFLTPSPYFGIFRHDHSCIYSKYISTKPYPLLLLVFILIVALPSPPDQFSYLCWITVPVLMGSWCLVHL